MTQEKKSKSDENVTFPSKCLRCGEFFLVDVLGNPVKAHDCPGIKQWSER